MEEEILLQDGTSSLEEVVVMPNPNDALAIEVDREGGELFLVVIGIAILLAGIWFILPRWRQLNACRDNCSPEGSRCGPCRLVGMKVVPQSDPNIDVKEFPPLVKKILRQPFKKLLPKPVRIALKALDKLFEITVEATQELADNLRDMSLGVDVWIYYTKPMCTFEHTDCQHGGHLKCNKISKKRKLLPPSVKYKFLQVPDFDFWDMNALTDPENRDELILYYHNQLLGLCDEEEGEEIEENTEDATENGEQTEDLQHNAELPACVTKRLQIRPTMEIPCTGTTPVTPDIATDLDEAHANAEENGRRDLEKREAPKLAARSLVCHSPCKLHFELENLEYDGNLSSYDIKDGDVIVTGVVYADLFVQCIPEERDE